MKLFLILHAVKIECSMYALILNSAFVRPCFIFHLFLFSNNQSTNIIIFHCSATLNLIPNMLALLISHSIIFCIFRHKFMILLSNAYHSINTFFNVRLY